uniref:FGFR1 oncogene partner (FOP) N-terminal dimerisation domain-containing protein n=1 Tax=Culex tarsalis TaxID=7177 RepID=A0A1Q3FT04_CULTA
MNSHPDPPNTDPEAKLLQTVRHCLEGDSYLRRARCDMRRKVLETIQGSGDNLFAGNQTDHQQLPPRPIRLINQLILEYLDWYNLQYTAEMFTVESGTGRLEAPVRRQMLQSSLKPALEDPVEFQPDLPVLAELVMKLTVDDNE